MNEQKKTACKELEAIRIELANALNQMRAPDMADIADSFSRIKKNHPENIAEACEELRGILEKYGTRAAEYCAIYKKLNFTDEYQKETRRICKGFRDYGERMTAIREQADKYPAYRKLFEDAAEAIAPCFFDDPETLQKLGPWGLHVAAIVVSKETTPDAVKLGIYKDYYKINKEPEERGQQEWIAFYDRYCANGCDIFNSLFYFGLVDSNGNILEAEATEAEATEAEATEAEATEAEATTEEATTEEATTEEATEAEAEATEAEATTEEEPPKEDCPKAKKATACKYNRRAVMAYAWHLCRLVVNGEGGKACDYFAAALREAWKVIKAVEIYKTLLRWLMIKQKQKQQQSPKKRTAQKQSPKKRTAQKQSPKKEDCPKSKKAAACKYGHWSPHQVRPKRPPPEPASHAGFREW